MIQPCSAPERHFATPQDAGIHFSKARRRLQMFKRTLPVWIALVACLALSLACGGKKDEDALMENESKGSAAKAAPAAAAPVAAPASAPAAGGATLAGKVAFEGAAPKMELIKMEADAYCKAEHKEPVYSQEVVVNSNNTLRWVLVYVKEGVTGNYPPPKEGVTLDQRGCQYAPHIFGIQVGQTLKILNSDSTLHNIHALPKKNTEFNIGQPFPKMVTEKKFDQVEVPVRFKCDVHKWMGAYCAVLNHPFFAVTSDQGTFEIKNLPPGNYVIEAWHERYGAQTQNVTVTGAESKTVDFSFKG
jgi:plastocyanin